jgi:hypothetical protein
MGDRFLVLRKAFKNPAVRERMAVVPVEKKFNPALRGPRISLGPAEADFGTNSFSFHAAGKKHTVVLAENDDVSLYFFMPFVENPPQPQRPATSTSERSSWRDRWPRAQLDHPVEAQLEYERALVQPWGRVFTMSRDDFLDYVFQISQKGFMTLSGRNEIFHFKTDTIRGLVRIGHDSRDRTEALVLLSSLDGRYVESVMVNLKPNSKRDIEEILAPILGSFAFTIPGPIDHETLDALIRNSGIQPKEQLPH